MFFQFYHVKQRLTPKDHSTIYLQKKKKKIKNLKHDLPSLHYSLLVC